MIAAQSLLAQDKVIYLDGSDNQTEKSSAFYTRNIFFTGDSVRVEQLFSSGKKYYVGHALKGTEANRTPTFIGHCTWYHKNGEVREEKDFDGNGKLNGLSRRFGPDGRLEYSAEYSNGILVDSQYKEYDKDGAVSSVFYDDFDENFSDWDLYESDAGVARIEDGKLHLESFTSRGLSRYIYQPIEAHNFSIEATFKHMKTKGASNQGILFNFIDWENYSYFIYQGRYFSIGKYEDGIQDVSANLFGTVSLSQDNDNVLRIEHKAGEVSYSINASVIFREGASKFEAGYVGFVVGGKGSAEIESLEIKQSGQGPTSIEDEDVRGSGTAFLIDNTGYLITNHHVIKDGDQIYVEFTQGALAAPGQFTAEVVLEDEAADLALLKITDARFPRLDALPYGLDVSGVGVGASVFALGYPFALSGMGTEVKFTDGKISSRTGYNNNINSYQTSVPVQPGSSGSPLFNENGDIVGCMNASVLEADNVSYAIKSSYINNLIQTASIDLDDINRVKIDDLSTEAQIKMLSQYVAIIKTR